jgi:ABC-type cobalamin/Fe3+-siderophores transport system ATPase subunit
MINALFRLVELEKGRMLIDNYDISSFGLTDLRKVLGIIPQSPVLFSGMIYIISKGSKMGSLGWLHLNRFGPKPDILKRKFGLCIISLV